MVKKENYTIIFASFFAVLLLGFIVLDTDTTNVSAITGDATTSDVDAFAAIANYFAISLSPNMTTDGIQFDIVSIPVNANSTQNFNATNDDTELYLYVSTDSNVNVDFCVKTNDSLRASGDLLLNWTNYTFTNATISDLTNPDREYNQLYGNTSWEGMDTNLAGGSVQYMRFWLNVPGTQSAGNYINEINFKGLQTGTACNT